MLANDLDGRVVAITDQESVTTEVDYDQGGLVSEVRVPHDDRVVRTTRYEYDPVGNQTRVITPRGVEAADPNSDGNWRVSVSVFDPQRGSRRM